MNVKNDLTGNFPCLTQQLQKRKKHALEKLFGIMTGNAMINYNSIILQLQFRVRYKIKQCLQS